MSDLTTTVTFNKELGEKGWAKAEEHVTRYSNLKTTKRDNSHQIANLHLTNGPQTSYQYGSIITAKVDLSTLMK